MLRIVLPSPVSAAALCPFLLWMCPRGSQLIASLLLLGKLGHRKEKEEAVNPSGEKHLVPVPFVQA